jgi:hypothetical protein
MDELRELISRTSDSPTIVNPNSHFVVITYWWGRGNLNNNVARPCVSFYEDFFKKIIKFAVSSIDSASKMYQDDPEKLTDFKDKLTYITESGTFSNILRRKINEYLANIYSYAGIMDNSSDKFQQALQFLEKLKETGKTPANYEFKNAEYLFFILYFISREYIKLNKQNIVDLFMINSTIQQLKAQFLNNVQSIDYKTQLKDLTQRKNGINDLIKKSLNIKNNYELDNVKVENKQLLKYLTKIYSDNDIQNKSLNELLIQELRYLSPLKFEEMIDNWKAQCSKQQCNFMAVEYPEFARPGGYQMAINAKPLFIKKCLQLCGGKSVLYIDGDMNIRKYPVLFDLTDVDYMARGWWIDPRSSYKMDESISYDPYTFETSGGTMFFSNSEESNLLLDMWINESGKTYQRGKADDRIISMIFNTKKLVLNMKVIQLPIEYLWLTLDYNERLLENEIYDYNETLMDASIIIDHPECLTSEDTASGSGASNDRTPKFYNFLEENVEPVSEEYFEYLAFPEMKYTEGLKDYLNFMSNVFYIDDGNKILYEKGFVEQGRNTSDNEQPLYIFPFQKKMGNKNEISEIIVKRSQTMNTTGLYVFNEGLNIAEIQDVHFMKEEEPDKPDLVKVMALIYKLLNEGKNVLYKPSTTDPTIYQNFMDNMTSKYKNCEFAFVPIFNGKTYNDIYRPLIDTNNCIYINYKSTFMKHFITLFESMDAMSSYVNNGFYQLISSVRIAYLIKRKPSTSPSGEMVGGNNMNYEDEYLEAMDYVETMQKHGGQKSKTRATTRSKVTKIRKSKNKNKSKSKSKNKKTKKYRKY